MSSLAFLIAMYGQLSPPPAAPAPAQNPPQQGLIYRADTTPGGEVEYVLQVERAHLQRLSEGAAIVSQVPDDPPASGKALVMDRLRIHYGRGDIPLQSQLAVARAIPDVTTGWEEDAQRWVEFIVQLDPVGMKEFQTGTQDILLTIPRTERNRIGTIKLLVGRERLPQGPPLAPPSGVGVGGAVASGVRPAGGVQTPPFSGVPSRQPPLSAPNLNLNVPPPRVGVGGPGYAAGPLPGAQPGAGAAQGYPPYGGAQPNAQFPPPGQFPTPAAVASNPPLRDPGATQTNRVQTPTVTALNSGAGDRKDEETVKADVPGSQIFVFMLLVASMAGNFYLGWICVGLYDRCRNAESDLRDRSRRAARD